MLYSSCLSWLLNLRVHTYELHCYSLVVLKLGTCAWLSGGLQAWQKPCPVVQASRFPCQAGKFQQSLVRRASLAELFTGVLATGKWNWNAGFPEAKLGFLFLSSQRLVLVNTVGVLSTVPLVTVNQYFCQLNVPVCHFADAPLVISGLPGVPVNPQANVSRDRKLFWFSLFVDPSELLSCALCLAGGYCLYDELSCNSHNNIFFSVVKICKHWLVEEQ